MAINVNDAFVTDIAMDYAKLCDLSKANWVWKDGKWVLDKGENDYETLWTEMSDEKKYIVLCFWDDTQTGYSGTLFYNSSTGKTILANRGTNNLQDFYVDLMSIASDNAPTEQFRSMVTFIKYAQDNSTIHLGNFDVIAWKD